MREVEDLNGGRDRFNRAFQLGDIGIAGAEVGKEGNEWAHGTLRLASGKEWEKRKERPERDQSGAHGLPLFGVARIDQLPEFWIFGQNLILRKGELRAKGEVFQ